MTSGVEGDMESGEGVSNVRNNMFKDWCGQFRSSNPSMARYVYGLLFLVANLLAWAARDYGHGPLTELERFKGCHGTKDCFGTEGVLRVSLGCFTFFIIMFLSTMGTKKLHVARDLWHSGWWSIKIILLIALTAIPFLVPAPFILLYGEIAHFGAGHIHVMLLATTAYLVCIVGIILMYIWYVPEPSCLLNIFFITWTLVLLQLMTSVSLHPKVNAGFLTPGLMGLYVVFICWCAIRSEPAGGRCNRKAEASNHTDWLTIISFVIALLAMVIATFSTGIDSQCFQFKKNDSKSEDDVPYGYGFFHFVFATGAMYFAMLLIGWNTHHPMKKWTIDVGWTSTWVRIVNEWLAVCVYLWMLVAPMLWKWREFGGIP
ncbi:probable serine incorporator isoform X2 [Rhodamnia argentea]|uniref:Probable serine incorporator isoform X2 n=1 Tax=Rhodamnia argentea TaxID=178133 RepID=A0A8B8N034_9MYRT|nr:probable serine incorporator isoform X2 [Rhodamnia argentea]